MAQLLLDDIDSVVRKLQRERRIKVVLVLGLFLGAAIGGMIFAQVTTGSSVMLPYR